MLYVSFVKIRIICIHFCLGFLALCDRSQSPGHQANLTPCRMCDNMLNHPLSPCHLTLKLGRRRTISWFNEHFFTRVTICKQIGCSATDSLNSSSLCYIYILYVLLLCVTIKQVFYSLTCYYCTLNRISKQFISGKNSHEFY